MIYLGSRAWKMGEPRQKSPSNSTEYHFLEKGFSV